MINIVYVDVYFCFNFIMDFIILYAMRLVLKEGGLLKDIVASILGASYSTFILIIGDAGILQILLTYLIIPGLMIVITSTNKEIKLLIKRLGVLYLFTFIISGVINAIYYGSFWGKTLIEKGLTMQIGNVNIWLILTVLICAISVLKVFRQLLVRNICLSQKIYEVSVMIGNEKIKAKGLLDTGNLLVEPITKKPVFIVEYNLIKHIKNYSNRPVFIPFKSVGKEHGLMQGFIADYLEIEGVVIDKPIIGIHSGKLSIQGKYNMILPPNISKGESK